jgi:hypothetical protein
MIPGFFTVLEVFHWGYQDPGETALGIFLSVLMSIAIGVVLV